MDKIKTIIDLIKTIWPIVLVIVPLVTSIICWLVWVGSTPVPMSPPLSLVVAVIALAIYPIVKTIQWLLNKKPVKTFEYSGLFWMPTRFNSLIPICPEKDCGCEVDCVSTPPPQVQMIGLGKSNLELDYHYTYKCPIHKVLGNVPDISLPDLVKNAKRVQSRRIPNVRTDKRTKV